MHRTCVCTQTRNARARTSAMDIDAFSPTRTNVKVLRDSGLGESGLARPVRADLPGEPHSGSGLGPTRPYAGSPSRTMSCTRCSSPTWPRAYLVEELTLRVPRQQHRDATSDHLEIPFPKEAAVSYAKVYGFLGLKQASNKQRRQQQQQQTLFLQPHYHSV